MNILKEFIDKRCHFLYDVYHSELIEEVTTKLFAGDGTIALSYSNLYLRFRNERGVFFLGFQSKYDPKKERYSIDLFKYIMLGDDNFTAVMEDENINFLKENLEKIDELLSESKLESTLPNLKKAMKLRVKKIFKKK